MNRIHTDGFDAIVAESQGVQRINITANLANNPQAVIDKTLDYLANENAEIITGFAFGNNETLKEMIPEQFSRLTTILQGDTCHCATPTAIQFTAISGTELIPIEIDGERVGTSFLFDGHTHCVLAGIHADTPGATRGANATAAFDKMLRALKSVNMDFSNVVRMWNYLDDLLTWYDEFNSVRNIFFTQHSVYDTLVPAGTGIGAANQHGTAYVGDLWAVQNKLLASSSNTPSATASKPDLATFAVPSPLQCPAIDYKSSFSRAIEIDSANFRTLSISGTASIEPGGKTVFLGDTAKQIDKTIQVIAAILESRNMDWSDTVRAIAYFADINDLSLLAERMEANGVPATIPMAISHAAVCRDDLLFEIELDAMCE